MCHFPANSRDCNQQAIHSFQKQYWKDSVYVPHLHMAGDKWLMNGQKRDLITHHFYLMLLQVLYLFHSFSCGPDAGRS